MFDFSYRALICKSAVPFHSKLSRRLPNIQTTITINNKFAVDAHCVKKVVILHASKEQCIHWRVPFLAYNVNTTAVIQRLTSI